MDQSHPSPPLPPPASAPISPGSSAPQVVHIVSKPTGFARAIGFIIGLFVFAVVFMVGVAFGGAAFFASSMFDTTVVGELYRDGGRNTVAIIPIEGIIDAHQAESVRLTIDHVLDDSSIKAAVLRVDSPGGGIAASDQIWYQVKRLRDAGLPVIASYGGVAASGGYYVSCGTDHIVAEPTCITGSIGVIAQTFIFEDLLNKIGVQPVTLLATDAPEKDLGNPFRSWTEKDHEKIRAMLDAAYDIFNQRVKDGRRGAINDPAKIDKLADGSIYTAQEASDNGLIDSIGYLDDAIARAEKMAGLPVGKSTVVILRRPTPLFGGVLSAHGPDMPATMLDAGTIRRMVNDLGSPRAMYLMR